MFNPELLEEMAEEDKAQLVEVIEGLLREHDRTKLSRYAPHPKQAAFHKAGGDPAVRERILLGGNQCLTAWTYLETPEGERLAGEVWRGEGGRVLALVGGQAREARWQAGMLRSIEPAFRVVLDNGRFFDCSRTHQVLTPEGWLSLDQLVSREGGLHCWQTPEDYLASCVADGRLCGRQLREAADIVQARLPSPAGAPARTLSWTQKDAEERTPARIRACLDAGPLTIAGDDEHLIEDLFALFSAPKLPQSDLRTSRSSQVLPRFAHEFWLRLQSDGAADPDRAFADFLQQDGCRDSEAMTELRGTVARFERQSLSVARPGHSVQELAQHADRIATFYPFQPPQLYGGARILAVANLGFQPIVDCQVPDHHNYFAAGVVHHNCGKTLASAAEIAMHLSGQYPDWWEGARWDYAPSGWACCLSAQVTRDTMQRLLLGPPGEWGSGMIPGDTIQEIRRAAGGVPDAVDVITVRHVSGGIATLGFRNVEQGRSKFQGSSIDFVALDEEPPEDIYIEALSRTNSTEGIVWITFTPLMGMSSVVKRFLVAKAPGTHVTRMTIDDALHYSEEQRERVLASYPTHEKEARTKGIPSMGSGLIYAVPEESITCEPFQIPPYFARICGLDFGWDHPTAAVWLAWDRDADIVYVTDVHAASQQTPIMHAAAIKARGSWIPVSWPPDGLSTGKDGGKPLADQYRQQGCNMLPHHATNAPMDGQMEGTGGTAVEGGIMEILDRMQTGRFKVFKTLTQWFDEFRMYHRKDGKIVKEDDDIMDGTRYACMMLRYAKARPKPRTAKAKPFRPLSSTMGY